MASEKPLSKFGPVTVGQHDWLPASTWCQTCSRPVPGTSTIPKTCTDLGFLVLNRTLPSMPMASSSQVFFWPGSMRLVSVVSGNSLPPGWGTQLCTTALSQVSQGTGVPSARAVR